MYRPRAFFSWGRWYFRSRGGGEGERIVRRIGCSRKGVKTWGEIKRVGVTKGRGIGISVEVEEGEKEKEGREGGNISRLEASSSDLRARMWRRYDN